MLLKENYLLITKYNGVNKNLYLPCLLKQTQTQTENKINYTIVWLVPIKGTYFYGNSYHKQFSPLLNN